MPRILLTMSFPLRVSLGQRSCPSALEPPLSLQMPLRTLQAADTGGVPTELPPGAARSSAPC